MGGVLNCHGGDIVTLTNRAVIVIIGGGIAAYKSLDLIRRLKKRGAGVRVILTEAATAFVTPLSVSALSGNRALLRLLDAESEPDSGHIRLAYSSDLIVVAPATADLMARMATGRADDLATAVLLAATCPILIAPAMNPAMWQHPATQRNFWRLMDDGVEAVGPNSGAMAEPEQGVGRMAEPPEIVAAAENLLKSRSALLAGKKVLVTAGPTYEAIDPVRFLGNRSSGKQGYAIARAAAAAGADVTLVSGPTALADPRDVRVDRVESAREMLAAVLAALPVDIAVFCAAVADWRVDVESDHKIKKTGESPPVFTLVENPDILSTVAHLEENRPKIVVGFAAETDYVLKHAREKLLKKGCDFILANDVSPERGIMGGDNNSIHVVTAEGVTDWPLMAKDDVARHLVAYLAEYRVKD
ncbi:MAG: bifunctional phosphopantothenoylcysteine decarboxylase/phosphopantothenate--cysteine ligase CoaBC [Methylobacteriaceae bacterium]|jgi:phosphopantothenoylcysteine decarboxylase/phosphopantothenate--cysteine ligase|nr:bifunctional phosphopantothenoylcysteine decarboxylase/phosphopantothenate--cysteine ligase CoaBC [Methylobacteriaceae bacterium]